MRFDSALCRLNLSGDVAAAATLGRVDFYGAEKSDKSYEWNRIFKMFKTIFFGKKYRNALQIFKNCYWESRDLKCCNTNVLTTIYLSKKQYFSLAFGEFKRHFRPYVCLPKLLGILQRLRFWHPNRTTLLHIYPRSEKL